MRALARPWKSDGWETDEVERSRMGCGLVKYYAGFFATSGLLTLLCGGP